MHYAIFVAKEKGKSLADIMHPFDENCEDVGVATKEIFCKAGEYLKYYETKIEPNLRDNLTSKEIAELAPELIPYSKKVLAKFEKVKNNDEKLAKYILAQEGGKKDKEGNLYYMCNHNAKWDWYSIGGRWNEYLVLADGKRTNKAKRKEIDLKATAEWENKIFPSAKPLEKFRPYGFLSNGEWVDRDDLKDKDFEKKFDEWWENLDPEMEIILVDCHD